MCGSQVSREDIALNYITLINFHFVSATAILDSTTTCLQEIRRSECVEESQLMLVARLNEWFVHRHTTRNAMDGLGSTTVDKSAPADERLACLSRNLRLKVP
jgi:hypothetical protein